MIVVAVIIDQVQARLQERLDLQRQRSRPDVTAAARGHLDLNSQQQRGHHEDHDQEQRWQCSESAAHPRRVPALQRRRRSPHDSAVGLHRTVDGFDRTGAGAVRVGRGDDERDRGDDLHHRPAGREPVLRAMSDIAAATAVELGYEPLQLVHDDDAGRQLELIESCISSNAVGDRARQRRCRRISGSRPDSQGRRHPELPRRPRDQRGGCRRRPDRVQQLSRGDAPAPSTSPS